MIRPRNDFVLIQMYDKGFSPGGVVIPQISIEGKEFIVRAIGPDVKDLEIGDSVLMMGTLKQDYDFLPGTKDMIIMKQANILLVIEPE